MTVLNCGPVVLYGGGSGSVTGAGNQWADGSDATYATSFSPSGGGAPAQLAAPLDDIPAGATVESITVHLRVSTDSPDGMFYSAYVSTDGGDTSVDTGGPFQLFPAAPAWVAHPITSLFGATRTSALGAGAHLYVSVAAIGVGSSFHVYEAYLEVVLTLPEVDEAPTYRRIFPRDDGLAGGAPRNYPRSKAVQSGNRIGAGYL